MISLVHLCSELGLCEMLSPASARSKGCRTTQVYARETSMDLGVLYPHASGLQNRSGELLCGVEIINFDDRPAFISNGMKHSI